MCTKSSLLATCFMLVSCVVYFSALNMEATCSSETSVDFQRTTRRYIAKNRSSHNYRCENIKSHKDICGLHQSLQASHRFIKYVMAVPLKPFLIWGSTFKVILKWNYKLRKYELSWVVYNVIPWRAVVWRNQLSYTIATGNTPISWIAWTKHRSI
jgi:hypothetical protein